MKYLGQSRCFACDIDQFLIDISYFDYLTLLSPVQMYDHHIL